jgi:hypothetical protein
VASAVERRTLECLVDSEWEGMLVEAVALDFPSGTEKDQEKPQDIWLSLHNSNPAPPEYESEASPLEPA